MGDSLRKKVPFPCSIPEFPMKFALSLALLLVSTSALAAAPRTLGRPLLHNKEMSKVPVGTCSHTRGCYEVQNWTGWAQVVGNTGPGAAPGNALIVDAANSGIPTGVYLSMVQVGWHDDAILGRMPAIDGQFVSVLLPGESAFVTVDPGVTEVRTWSLMFEPELNKAPVTAFDMVLGRVVEYSAGVPTRLPGRDCKVENNPFIETGSPELARITPGDCRH